MATGYYVHLSSLHGTTTKEIVEGSLSTLRFIGSYEVGTLEQTNRPPGANVDLLHTWVCFKDLQDANRAIRMRKLPYKVPGLVYPWTAKFLAKGHPSQPQHKAHASIPRPPMMSSQGSKHRHSHTHARCLLALPQARPQSQLLLQQAPLALFLLPVNTPTLEEWGGGEEREGGGTLPSPPPLSAPTPHPPTTSHPLMMD
ncbi:hypothetical protein Pelo_10573 [Pelomyxa schiedti]|nr:hypothetical protein Pelo_10573 [Pelomyxa schiedti]